MHRYLTWARSLFPVSLNSYSCWEMSNSITRLSTVVLFRLWGVCCSGRRTTCHPQLHTNSIVSFTLRTAFAVCVVWSRRKKSYATRAHHELFSLVLSLIQWKHCEVWKPQTEGVGDRTSDGRNAASIAFLIIPKFLFTKKSTVLVFMSAWWNLGVKLIFLDILVSKDYYKTRYFCVESDAAVRFLLRPPLSTMTN